MANTASGKGSAHNATAKGDSEEVQAAQRAVKTAEEQLKAAEKALAQAKRQEAK